MKQTERYQLTCFRCSSRLEIPVHGPHVCLRCGSPLRIEWQSGRAEIASQSQPDHWEEADAA
jgi:rRNA maturation endonuclease Nob1